MHSPFSRSMVALGILAGSAWAGSRIDAAPASMPHTACAVSVDEPIPNHRDATEVIAKYTEPIGDSLSARFPEDAHVSVTRVKPGEEQLTAVLTLNTLQAVEGEWALTLTGQSGECQGKVNIGAGAR
jgi:hypothetical protein